MNSKTRCTPGKMARLRKRSVRTALRLLLLSMMPLLAGAQCEKDPEPQPPPPQPKPVNLVVLGDSLSAGHQNGCTVQWYVDANGNAYPSQEMGYAYVIARQAGWFLDPPYIGQPGARPCFRIGADGDLLTLFRRPVPDPDGGPGPGDPDDSRTWGGRLYPNVPTRNLSSPGTRIVDIFDTPPAKEDPGVYHWNFGLDYLAMWSRFADTPDRTPDGSLLKQAVGFLANSYDEPLVALMWLGSNDALWSALGGTELYMTPAADFENAAFAALAALTATGAHVIVGNVPDLTVAPHFMPAGVFAGLFLAPGPPPFEEIPVTSPTGLGCTFSELTGLAQTDYVVAFTAMQAFGALYAAGCGSGPLPPEVVLTAAEVVAIQTRIGEYNTALATATTAYGATLVDVATLLSNAATGGYVIGAGTPDEETLGAGFCEGIFSLDGVHPNNTGYAAVANEFIRAINTTLALAGPDAIPQADEVLTRQLEPPHNTCLAPPAS